jgi:hypothetical protein
MFMVVVRTNAPVGGRPERIVEDQNVDVQQAELTAPGLI